MKIWKKIKVFARTKFAKSSYQIHGVTIPIDRKFITDRILYSIIRGRYEGTEARAVMELVKPEDRVLELGGGVGLISTVAAKIVGDNSVVCVEANPKMIDYIQKVHKANGIAPKIINAVAVGKKITDSVRFYLRKDFWVSSMSPLPDDYIEVVSVPVAPIDDLVNQHNPSVVIIDIEGGEVDLLVGNWADKVRLVIMELHTEVTGAESMQTIVKFFKDRDFSVEVHDMMLFAKRN